MLVLPEAPPIYRILSIDPGSDTLGLALIDVDLEHHTATLVHTNTLNATRAIRQMPFTAETFGDRQARLTSHAHVIRDYLGSARPHCVISESPFMGRFPQAFASLVECMYMLQAVVAEYDPGMCLETIDPPSVKKLVGAPTKRPKGMSPTDFKGTVKTALKGLSKLQLGQQVSLDYCDEHAIDAVAVGCYKVHCIDANIL